MRERLAVVSESEQDIGSAAICGELSQIDIVNAAAVIVAYHPHGGEVGVAQLFWQWVSDGKRVCLPRMLNDVMEIREATRPEDLEPGHLGIIQPRGDCVKVALEEIEMVIVPGLAFDTAGRRLGRGKGHYDRFLAGIPAHVPRIGICHDWQLRDASVIPVPTASHDQRMNWICTPMRLIDCSGNG
ncbi:5-formyltetrahydrofolate cyclo-ligase [soil metagenome]